MKKPIIYLTLFIASILLIFFGSISLIKFDKAYMQFAKNAKIDVQDLNSLKYKISKFPSPELIIEEIKQDKKIELKNVKIQFSLFPVLLLDHKISKLEIEKAKIYLSNNDVNLINHNEFISELISKNIPNISAKIKQLEFVESDKDTSFIIKNLSYSGNNNNNKFTGIVESIGKINGNFKLENNTTKFNLNIEGSKYILRLNEIYENSILKEGKVAITTSSMISKLTELFLPDIKHITQNLSEEKVTIRFDLKPTSQFLKLNNIDIDSESIKGKGTIAIGKDSKNLNKIKIDFSKLDVNKLTETKYIKRKKNRLFIQPDNKLDFNKIKIQAEFSAKTVEIDNNNLLSNVKLKSIISDGTLNIEDFSGIILPKAAINTAENFGEFKLTGTAKQNSFRTLFTGQLALTHGDLNDLVEFIGNKELRSKNKIPYVITSNIKFSSVDLSLQNLHLKTQDTELIGDISTKFIGNAPRTNATLNFTKVNLDSEQFPVLKKIYQSGLDLTLKSKEENYLNEFIPIRKINTTSNYDLTFDNLILHNTEYKNVTLNIGVSPGRIKLENLGLNKGKDNINMSIELLASGIKPSFNILIHSGVIEFPYFSPNHMLELKNKILKNFNFDQVDLNLNFNLDELYNGSFKLNDVIFRAKNNKSLLEISNFNAQMTGGKMVSSGSILLAPYTLNFAYALNSANLAELSKAIPLLNLSTQGAISASGIWSTKGNSPEELLYNLYIKSNIVTKDIAISNFSIDEMVQAASAPNYNTKNFQNDMKKALLTGTTEISDLKAMVELSNGIFTLKDIAFKTKYTAGVASANFNLYDSNIDLNSIFSFYLAKPSQSRSRAYTDYNTVKLDIRAQGNIFNPDKEANTKDFEEKLNARKQL